MQAFRIYRERALILMGQAKPSEALVEFRKAMQYPRMWRSEVLPADSTILNFEKFMNGEIQQEFLDAIGALPEEKFTRELAEESFWVAEEARFSSLRAAFLERDEIAKRLGELLAVVAAFSGFTGAGIGREWAGGRGAGPD